MAWDVVFEHSLITAGIHILEKVKKTRFLTYRLIQPNRDIRIAFSAVLRVHYGGKYILIRNLHRPEVYAPIGGIYKYYSDSKRFMDDIQFRLHDIGRADDIHNDLRGFLPQKHLARLVKWYSHRDGRESTDECLRREIREEISEIGAKQKLKVPESLRLRHVRTIEEGPEKVPGQSFRQFRIFEVYEPRWQRDKDAKAFFGKIASLARQNDGLLITTPDEIIAGRAAKNQIIAHHATYLVNGKRIRSEDPPFAYEVEEQR